MEIGHIGGNPLNNKINNLRLVSGMQNSRNRKMHINNTSGHTEPIGIKSIKNGLRL